LARVKKFLFIVFMMMPIPNHLYAEKLPDIGHAYCTYADSQYFPFLMNLIGSIHEVDFKKAQAHRCF